MIRRVSNKDCGPGGIARFCFRRLFLEQVHRWFDVKRRPVAVTLREANEPFLETRIDLFLENTRLTRKGAAR